MSADDTVCLWYNNAFSCAARSMVTQSESCENTRISSLRNSNEIHEYIGQLVTKVSKFSSKLTGFEQDDWLEKIENLENVSMTFFRSVQNYVPNVSVRRSSYHLKA